MSKNGTAAIHLQRGRESRLANRFEEALAHFETALRLNPGCARAHAGYGATLARLGHAARAIEAYWQSLRLQVVQPRVYGALANLYLEEGRADSASDCLRQAVAQAPDDEILRSNLLYVLNFDRRTSPEELFREHCEFGKRLGRHFGAGAEMASKTLAQNRLCLGRFLRPSGQLFLRTGAREPPARKLRNHALFQYGKTGFPHAAIAPAALPVARRTRGLGCETGRDGEAGRNRYPGGPGGPHFDRASGHICAQACSGAGHLPGLPRTPAGWPRWTTVSPTNGPIRQA